MQKLYDFLKKYSKIKEQTFGHSVETAVFLLQAFDKFGNTVNIDEISSIKRNKNLNCTKCVQNMGRVTFGCTVSTIFILRFIDDFQHKIDVRFIHFTEYIQCG